MPVSPLGACSAFLQSAASRQLRLSTGTAESLLHLSIRGLSLPAVA